VIRRSLEIVANVLPCDAVYVLAPSDGGYRVTESAGEHLDHAVGEELPRPAGGLPWEPGGDKPLLASARAAVPGVSDGFADWIAVPLELSESVQGALALIVSRVSGRFDEDQLSIAVTLFEQCFIAYRNANLFSQVTYLANSDELTGLSTRRCFFERAGAAVAAAQRRGEPLAAIMLDVDHFKSINDKHGHPVGDEVLKALGARLRETLRASDVVGRYGGEEFVAILAGASPTVAEIAERLRRSVSATPIETRDGPIPVTVSIGLAFLTPDDCDLDALLRRADASLYQAKRGGRNQVVAAEPIPTP
jgi:diguanylate cyclase (GGDEF)-like protein